MLRSRRSRRWPRCSRPPRSLIGAGGDYVPGQVIVKFRSGVTRGPGRRSCSRARAPSDKLGRVRGVGAELVSVAGERSARRPRVLRAVVGGRVRRGGQDPHRAAPMPNDTQFAEQYALRRDQGAPGLGPRRARRVPRRRGASRSGSSTRESTARTPSSPGRISNCAQSTAFFGRQRRRYAPGATTSDGHGTKVAGILGREGEQRPRDRGRRVQLAARGLPRAGGRPRHGDPRRTSSTASAGCARRARRSSR